MPLVLGLVVLAAGWCLPTAADNDLDHARASLGAVQRELSSPKASDTRTQLLPELAVAQAWCGQDTEALATAKEGGVGALESLEKAQSDAGRSVPAAETRRAWLDAARRLRPGYIRTDQLARVAARQRRLSESRANQLFREALEEARGAETIRDQVTGLLIVGGYQHEAGSDTEAATTFREALTLAAPDGEAPRSYQVSDVLRGLLDAGARADAEILVARLLRDPAGGEQMTALKALVRLGRSPEALEAAGRFPRAADRARLFMEVAKARAAAGAASEAEKLLQRASGEARQQPAAEAAWLLTEVAVAARAAGKVEGASALLREAAPLARQIGNNYQRALYLTELGRQQFLACDGASGERTLKEARRSEQAITPEDTQGDGPGTEPEAVLVRGLLGERRFAAAVAVAERRSDADGRAGSLEEVAAALGEAGRPTEAQRVAGRIHRPVNRLRALLKIVAAEAKRSAM